MKRSGDWSWNRRCDQEEDPEKIPPDTFFSPLDIRPEKMNILYNGVVAEPFFNLMDSKKAKERLLLNPNDRVVTMIARLHPIKNHGMFIEMAAQVLRDDPDVRFMLVGDGPEEARLKDEVKRRGLEASVLFLGRRGDIPDILAATDISVLTSDHEGFSNTVLESMCAGKPVTVTDYQGYDEIITHQKNGLVCPCGRADVLAEKVILLLKDASLRQSLGCAGREYVMQQLTPDVMAHNLESILQARCSGINGIK